MELLVCNNYMHLCLLYLLLILFDRYQNNVVVDQIRLAPYVPKKSIYIYIVVGICEVVFPYQFNVFPLIKLTYLPHKIIT